MTTELPNLCLKEGVGSNGPQFCPEMVRVIQVARETAPPLEDRTVWITSANDGHHMDDSLHYKDRGLDIRIKNIIGDVKREAHLWAERMQVALGDDYDVVKEKDHIHIEFDPEDPDY